MTNVRGPLCVHVDGWDTKAVSNHFGVQRNPRAVLHAVKIGNHHGSLHHSSRVTNRRTKGTLGSQLRSFSRAYKTFPEKDIEWVLCCDHLALLVLLLADVGMP